MQIEIKTSASMHSAILSHQTLPDYKASNSKPQTMLMQTKI
jgi:hypothetical protein